VSGSWVQHAKGVRGRNLTNLTLRQHARGGWDECVCSWGGHTGDVEDNGIENGLGREVDVGWNCNSKQEKNPEKKTNGHSGTLGRGAARFKASKRREEWPFQLHLSEKSISLKEKSIERRQSAAVVNKISVTTVPDHWMVLKGGKVRGGGLNKRVNGVGR